MFVFREEDVASQSIVRDVPKRCSSLLTALLLRFPTHGELDHLVQRPGLAVLAVTPVTRGALLLRFLLDELNRVVVLHSR